MKHPNSHRQPIALVRDTDHERALIDLELAASTDVREVPDPRPGAKPASTCSTHTAIRWHREQLSAPASERAPSATPPITSEAGASLSWRPADQALVDRNEAIRVAIFDAAHSTGVLGGNNVSIRYSPENLVAFLSLGAQQTWAYENGSRRYSLDLGTVNVWMLTPEVVS